MYRGPGVLESFSERLLQEEKAICEHLSNVKPMQLTPKEEQDFQTSEKCHICEKPLGADRVRDHDHLSGQFRGAAHSYCNIQYQFRQGKRSQTSKFYIPGIFHNLRGYDMHHLIASAGKFKDKRISCIPNNMEKYISFSLGNLRFIDSLQFMNASLDVLVANLTQKEMEKEEKLDKFKNMCTHFPDPAHHDLLLRKVGFPYDLLTSSDKFAHQKLPAKEHFYNKLNESEISNEC